MALLTEETGIRLEHKMDVIICALGLSDNHRLAPVEVEQKAKNIVLKFQKKRNSGQKYDGKAS